MNFLDSVQQLERDATGNNQNFFKNIIKHNKMGLSFSLTENHELICHDLRNGQPKKLFEHKFSNVLYTVCPMTYTDSNTFKFLASVKSVPLRIYSYNTELNQFALEKGYELLNPDIEAYHNPLTISQMVDHHKYFVGGKKFVRIFDAHHEKFIRLEKLMPKKHYVSVSATPKCKMGHDLEDQVAIGTFDKSIYLLDVINGTKIGEINGHLSAVTDLKFLPSNPYHQISGARKDDFLYLWDLRKSDTYLKLFYRDANTNQRMHFDVTNNGELLFTGDSSGNLLVYDIDTGAELTKIKFDKKILNSVQVYEDPKPEINTSFLLTSCGERNFSILNKRKIITSNDSSSDFTDSEDLELGTDAKTNLMNIWKVDLNDFSKLKTVPGAEKQLDESNKVENLQN